MSIAPQALERSVLERKERDELAAIAEAMGVKSSTRASKATLIDSILREAGIETGTEERPKRARTSRSAQAAANGAANGGAPAAGSDDGGATDVTAPPRPVTDPETDPSTDPPVIEPLRPATEPAPETSPGEPSTEPSPTEVPSSSVQPSDGTAEGAPETAGGPTTAGATGEAPTTTGSAPGAGDRTSQATANGTDKAPSPAGQGGQQQSGGARTDERSRDRNRENRDNRDRDNRDRDRDNNRSQHGGNDADQGNRRSRRRRGRNTDRVPQQDRGDDVQYSGEPIPAEGLLDLHEKGYGFLRTSGYLASPKDVYVSVSQVRRFGLRKGDYVKGASRPAGSSESWPALLRIDTVSGMTADEARQRPKFEDLTPLFPDERLRLEVSGDTNNMVSRIVDLISPIGKGQRGLIVSPPKAGKTTVLKQIAHSIEANNPEVHLMVLLVDERPEEVTDMRRSVKGEVVASTFDRPSDEHTQVAELTLERAKRLVEVGTDVCIVLDGITRLSRAYNLAAPATGRIMSGGIDVGALYPPKKFFGSARNIEEGGSITILATALVETGSRMDEVIFEEFKGTGNMELRLDRKLAERRIYPALDVNGSSTRHEELLFERIQLQQVWKLRRVLNALEGGAGLELLMDKIKATKSNDEFLAEIAKAPAPAG